MRCTGPATILLAAGLAAAAVAAALPPNIAAAARDPARAEQATQDATRHGPEILAFAGVRPGETVIELVPGGGYWTRLFAKAVGPKGHVYGTIPSAYAAKAGKGVAAYQALAGSADYPNVTATIQPATEVAAPVKADLVFTAQNYHDYPNAFMGSVDPVALAKAVFAALKPGGTYLVIDHAAQPGSGLRDTNTLHRIDPAAVRTEVEAAGFRFAGESRLLANPADDHSMKVFDPAVRGHTDQFIYKFRKPG